MTEESSPCLRSGFCCKQGPCPFGEGTPCIYLGGDAPGNYFCEKYDEIQKHPSAHLSPAFGAGCCSTLFNPDRDSLRKEKR